MKQDQFKQLKIKENKIKKSNKMQTRSKKHEDRQLKR
eukprot:CAMPEP_0206249220 /NCGR_PEP_ID=MMETSP0047_2-20121206/20793_1 /ASSEMBLY_ACC=CAM_ASM_000192 /TAXON_ID=195065 /ORGANISM="Chroomonas mesostigmatica_cf, Strain CCMP1168" /LENGTH=36 /DNA_ID= /DNA_START= /DNA_END= /DNA_ORIENTATION=